MIRRVLSSRLSPWAALAVSVAILTAVPTWWLTARHADDVGTVPIQVARWASPPAQSHRSSSAIGLVVHSARLADQPPLSAGRGPQRLRIPAIGLNASVSPVGIESVTGAMAIPADVRTLGWYRFSSSPGSPGSTVVVGHVDSAIQGKGAFFKLQDLGPGATIDVEVHRTRWMSFRVVARRMYTKGKVPAFVFARSGPSMLVLVTCGGSFDWSTRRYADNVVVFAVPNR
jgi:hypothetical protein